MKMHTNRHQEAKLLPPDTFLSRKNAQKCVFGRGSGLDTAGGAYIAPHTPYLVMGEGPPRRGREKDEGEDGGEKWEGEGVGKSPGSRWGSLQRSPRHPNW